MRESADLADVVRALGRLDPADDTTKWAIASTLGYEWSPPISAERRDEAPSAAADIPLLCLNPTPMIPRRELFAQKPVRKVPVPAARKTRVLEDPPVNNAGMIGWCIPLQPDAERFQGLLFQISDALEGAMNSKFGVTGTFDFSWDDVPLPPDRRNLIAYPAYVVLLVGPDYAGCRQALEGLQFAMERYRVDRTFHLAVVTMGAPLNPPIAPDAPTVQIGDLHPDSYIPMIMDLLSMEREPIWLEAASLDAYEGAHGATLPRRVSLLREDWQRGILFEAGSQHATPGGIDLDRLIDRIAKAAPIKEVPRKMRRSLRLGMQILIDVGMGMQPFHADQDSIIEALGALLPEEDLRILMFSNCPSRGCQGAPAWQDAHWTPVAGVPVVLITDLGIGAIGLDSAAAGLSEWSTFLDEAERANCPVVAFVPYGRDRWPKTLADRMRIVTWDRTTTADDVRRARRSCR